MARRGLELIGMMAALAGVLLALPVLAQAPAPPSGAQPAAPPGAAPGDPSTPSQDFSRTGAGRRDTVVRRPKDGDTISVRLPLQGQLFINSQVPWAVTGGKESSELRIMYDVRGIELQHIGTGSGSARARFNLRLVDGRTITINVRTAGTKYKVGYAIII
ncbi:MAG: hypothetical protein HY060_04485 [Proteobacteria bacterium]|nr:hypothetical protein [Pseudomonadota bacterium]